MFDGFINFYKPTGISSQNAVLKLKHILKDNGIVCDKIGHLGTLDPIAEGVLPVALGKATRMFGYFLEKRKKYTAVFAFGRTSDTLDSSGVIVEQGNADVTKDEILAVIPSLTGEIAQMPPDYSAKSIGGVRAYKLARAGIKPDLKPKMVNIYSIKLLEKLGKGLFSFEIECGGGTYIRSIVRDIAEKLNTVGLMESLVRTETGGFNIKDAQTIEDILKNGADILPLETVSSHFPKYEADISKKFHILNGVRVTLDGMPDGLFVLYIDGKLIGIAEKTEDSKIIIRTRLTV